MKAGRLLCLVLALTLLLAYGDETAISANADVSGGGPQEPARY